MRGLGFALILFGIITAVLILLYGGTVGWSGLVGSVAAVMTGVGFLSLDGGVYRTGGCGQCRSNCEQYHSSCPL